ncbi:MAG: DNA-3-methyladenine glycosylase [Oscillospiraceae bacterium]|nr:DNA-3-methyladenine glycosylase [Oscillospiraceae bacterium]
MAATRLDEPFYARDVLTAAPELLGKLLCRRLPDGSVLRRRVTETEAYRGEEDSACHAHKGKTKRSATLYEPGGRSYVYLCYGIHALLNVVTGLDGQPQGALIRGVEGMPPGPGRLTKALNIRVCHNGLLLYESELLWLEDDGFRVPGIEALPRVGIAYATREDQERLWRFRQLCAET